MDYLKLVDVYEALSKTTKKLEKRDILAKFFKDLKSFKEPILLVQGKVFSARDERKIGMSGKLVIRAIALSSGVDRSEVERVFKKKGDLGDVAFDLIGVKKQRTLFSGKLSVEKVFENIRKLSSLEGEGTVDKKVKLVAELLTSAKPIEAKYVVKTIVEEMRVGVASGIVRDAIAKAFDSEAKDIEKAFNVIGSYSEVAFLAKEKRLEKVGLVVGKPVKVMLAVLVKNVADAFKAVGSPAMFEYKYDGFRCITGHTKIYTNPKGLLSVKDIKVGDKVMTHKGNFNKVLSLNKRIIDKKERMFKIKPYFGNAFKITEGHNILIYRKGKKVWLPVENISKKDKLIFPVPKIKKESILNKSLLLKDKSNYSKRIPINNKFFRFLGYWIGDGFTNNYHNTERVGLVFNKNHKKLIKYYKEAISSLFKINPTEYKPKKNNVVNLYWRDKPFREWLTQYFRREWRGKMLPDWFYGINKKQFLEFIKGWLESDGHTDKFGRSSITTKERDLAMFAQLLGLKFGFVYGIQSFVVKGKTYYSIRLSKTKYQYKGNYFLIDIQKINAIKSDPRTVVYNLQVEGDESYCIPMVALHNCEIHRKGDSIKLFTRRMDEVTKQFPDVVEAVKSCIKGDDYVIDCEAVGFDKKTGKYLPFQKISQRIKRKYNIEGMASKFPVELNVFDVLYSKGKSLMNVELKERRKLLSKIIKEKKKKVVLTKSLITSDEKKALDFFKKAISDGLEGVMVKNLNSVYRPGRYVKGWVKLKEILEPLDLVIVGAEYGHGKRAGVLSSFILACRSGNKFLECGKMGTGIKELKGEGVTFKELTKMLKPLIISESKGEVKIKPEIVVEVGYEEIQKSSKYGSGYALRFPRLLRMRVDEKKSSDSNTLRDLERIYKVQKGK